MNVGGFSVQPQNVIQISLPYGVGVVLRAKLRQPRSVRNFLPAVKATAKLGARDSRARFAMGRKLGIRSGEEEGSRAERRLPDIFFCRRRCAVTERARLSCYREIPARGSVSRETNTGGRPFRS